MARSALRQSNLFADAPHEGDIWLERLLAAFADATLHSGFLPLAEQAIEARPGDAIILMLAAMAALLDERPKRALVLPKRFSKRASAPAADLLHALALNQLGKWTAARALLESNSLNSRWSALRVFPGGSERLPWLIQQLDNIVGRKVARPGRAGPSLASLAMTDIDARWFARSDGAQRAAMALRRSFHDLLPIVRGATPAAWSTICRSSTDLTISKTR